jgi:hypothetical protein
MYKTMITKFLNRKIQIITYIKNKNLGIVMLLLFGLTGCKQNSTPSVKQASVNPFDTTHFETQSLTTEDRAKLASATGKKAMPVSIDALSDKILQSTDKLHIYCFWNLHNAGSTETLKALKKVSDNHDSLKLKVIFVNMPLNNTADDVNLFIREQQLTDDTYILEKADISFFSKKIKRDVEPVTALPVLIMVNKSDDLLQFYNKPMDENELTALVNPLTL